MLVPFLAVTAHWIAVNDSKLMLRVALIAFHRLKSKHTGKNIARTLLHILDRAGIKNKVSFLVEGKNAAHSTFSLAISPSTMPRTMPLP
jgi:hypothetical protein